MASPVDDPKGLELEDFVAAHFLSRGCFVETGVKERTPDEILELDIVWTDYRTQHPIRHPVEVKSGEWGIGDLFKFYGWTQYLNLESGEFIYKIPCGRVSGPTLEHLEKRTSIRLVQVKEAIDIEEHFRNLGLPAPGFTDLPELWRFSFWTQRKLFKSLSAAIKLGVCAESARAAKEYYHLINDAVFFISYPKDQIQLLLDAHMEHQDLGATAACEIETGKADFVSPSHSRVFNQALYSGRFYPVQACLYLAHRARLYILKALVDYWLAENEKQVGMETIKLPAPTRSMSTALTDLSTARSFRYFPIFWQVFLWSWGGFLLEDRLDDEYEDLAKETGVLIEDIPLALSAFDKLFPFDGGWLRDNASRY